MAASFKVFSEDFNKANKHNDFFTKVIAKRIAKFERSRHSDLNIALYSVEFLTNEIKKSYIDVDLRDRSGIDAFIHLKDKDNKILLSIPVQLKSIFTSFRTVSVGEKDVNDLSNVKYYITIYDDPNGNHEFIVVKSKLLKEFITEKSPILKRTIGYYRQNQIHSDEAFYAIPVYCQASGHYIHQELSAFSNNLALYCEVKYDTMEKNNFKRSLEMPSLNSII